MPAALESRFTASKILGPLLLAALASLPAAAAEPAVEDGDLDGQIRDATLSELEALRPRILAAGMRLHDALRDGLRATARLRSDLRRELRAHRDAARLAAGLVVHDDLTQSPGPLRPAARS